MSQQAPQRNDDQNILAVTILFGIVIALMFVVFLNQPVPQVEPEVAAVPTEAAPAEVTAEATAETVAVAPTADPGAQPVSYSEADVRAGQMVFSSLCFACHGMGGVGVPGLGKPLVGSEFVNGLTDEELVAFITVGRPIGDPLNTTGQVMPAKGGNPALTEQDLMHVVAYLRSLNGAPVGAASAESQPTADPNVTPTAVRRPGNASNWTPPVLGGGAAEATPEVTTEPPAEATVAPTAAPTAEATTEAQGAVSAPVSDEAARLYASYCASCHGPAGEGVGGQAALVGVDMDLDAFVQEITVPAPVGALPTGFVHPFRGGFPTLTDPQIADIVAVVQAFNQ